MKRRCITLWVSISIPTLWHATSWSLCAAQGTGNVKPFAFWGLNIFCFSIALFILFCYKSNKIFDASHWLPKWTDYVILTKMIKLLSSLSIWWACLCLKTTDFCSCKSLHKQMTGDNDCGPDSTVLISPSITHTHTCTHKLLILSHK